MTLLKTVSLVAILVVLTLSTGCASSYDLVNERLLDLTMSEKKEPNETYIVDPPDSITIEFVAREDRDMNRTAQVRSDGTVTLMLLEDVHVAGLTTIEISRKLEELYSAYFYEPEILVSVSAYRSKHIYTYGEVGRQGNVPYTGNQTVADVIGTVNGVTSRAWLSRVKVIRGDPDDPEVYRVDLKKLIREGDMRQNMLLAEDDVIRVPPDPFAWVGYQIDKVLFPFRSLLSAVFVEKQAEGAISY